MKVMNVLMSPGTYTDKGDDVEKLLENARTELNILRERKAAGKQSFDNLQTDVTYNEEGRNDLKTLKVYRLLREDQWDCILSGLQPNNAESSTSAVDHVLNGSNNDDTPFISVTKRYEVALFFASKAYHERGERDLRIAVIKLDASKEGLLDVSHEIIRRDQGFEKRSTEDNFANCFEEVLLQRNIEPNEIIGVHVVNTKLPWCQTFRDFRPKNVDISVAFPSSNVISYLLPFFEKVVDSLLKSLSLGYHYTQKLDDHRVGRFLMVAEWGTTDACSCECHISSYVEISENNKKDLNMYGPVVASRIHRLRKKLDKYWSEGNKLYLEYLKRSGKSFNVCCSSSHSFPTILNMLRL